uniref:FH2 domain-containing protein n=1 Tax=Timspurckia oligopyrenoides TaxID=708627 RepID=A0A7S1EPU7_9RHOD|mmetsp:Transcript_11448/g.20713  ORF Transcript_11448/g.20713 Transcript_11448/m.20713 type:complete len:671 (+) Transcript_11448:43-2055(+)
MADSEQIKLTRRRDRQRGPRLTLEERLGPEVIKRLEAMAHEFVRFERGKFGFYIDPARYAVKQRQVGPLGKGRRRKVVAGVDKDGNVITAWVGVQGTQTKADKGETVTIPKAYEDGAGGDGGDDDGEGGGGGGRRRGRGGKGRGGGRGDGSGSGSGSSGSGSGSGEGGGGGHGKGKGGGGGGAGDKKDGEKKKKDKKDPPPPSDAAAVSSDPAKPSGFGPLAGGGGGDAATGPAPDALSNEQRGRKKKPLHWQKVPNNLVANSFWPSLDQTRITLREDEIDALFGQDVKEDLLGGAEEQKPEVLPHKRKHNVNILLANVKMSADEIHDIIRENRYREMDPGALQAILLVCPTPEEEVMLKNSAAMIDQVDRTDKYMMELAEMPGLRGKILCALSALTFNDEAVEIIRKMDLYVQIPDEIMKSEKLNKWLETILAMGNFLNSGTPKGGAHGYKLEALAMLSTVKDSKGNTLLDYIFTMIIRDNPFAYPIDDMPNLATSADMSLDGVNEDVQGLLESVTNVGEQIKTLGADASLSAFKADMESFSAEAMKTREEIVSLRGQMMSKLEEMMVHYGERNKAARGRQEDIMRMIREFLQDIDICAAKYQEKLERQNKQAKESKEKKKKEKKEKKKDKKSKGEDAGDAAEDAPADAAPAAEAPADSAPAEVEAAAE